MTITGWAILGTVPAGLLARRRYWRTAVAVGLVCVVILPGGWWSLQVELSEPQPLSGTVQRAPAAPFGASFTRTAHLGGPTSLMSQGARWLVPVPDTHIPEGLLLNVARVFWYGAWSLGALMYLAAPLSGPDRNALVVAPMARRLASKSARGSVIDGSNHWAESAASPLRRRSPSSASEERCDVQEHAAQRPRDVLGAGFVEVVRDPGAGSPVP